MFLTNIYSIDYVKFKLGCLNPGFYKSRIVYTFTLVSGKKRNAKMKGNPFR